jgi:hypothetical protein
MTPVESLLHEIDVRWRLQAAAKIPLHLIGCSALLLQTQYNRGTKDGDVLETAELVAEARDQLLELAGEHTSLHKRHRDLNHLEWPTVSPAFTEVSSRSISGVAASLRSLRARCDRRRREQVQTISRQ